MKISRTICMSPEFERLVISCSKKAQQTVSGFMRWCVFEIAKTMFPLTQIEGSSWKLETLMGVPDSLKVMES